MIAIQGFATEAWGLRNSSMQAYAALLKRALNLRQGGFIDAVRGITAAEFFSHFPVLHPFLLTELTEAWESTQRGLGGTHPCLYPVLLLLSSFRCDAAEAPSERFPLDAFLGPISACAKQAPSHMIV